MALVLGRLRSHAVLLWFALLPGVLAHELAHWVVAVILWADPGPPNIIPQRLEGGAWALGHVQLAHVRWWNAAPVALAPLVLLVAALWLASYAQRISLHHAAWAVLGIYAGACCLACAWPSRADWSIAARSAPAAMGLALLLWWAHTPK